MANEKNAPKAAAEEAGPVKQTVYVNSVRKEGFRRIGRHFGPDQVEVEVTDDELRELLNAPGQLRVLTGEMKAQLDKLTARPAPKGKEA